MPISTPLAFYPALAKKLSSFPCILFE